MPNTCAVAGCSDFAEPSKSIGLETFSEDNEFKRNTQRLYTAFGRTKCKMVSHSYNTRMLSQHFKADDFESPFIVTSRRFSLVVLF